MAGRESERMGEYERLTRQCESLSDDLSQLRQRHFDMLARREQAERERDDLRRKYDLARAEASQLSGELHAAQTATRQLTSRLQQAEQELAEQRKVNGELRQEVAVLSGRGGSDQGQDTSTSTSYSLLAKYEALHEDYDDLKKQYREVSASAASDRSRLEQMERDMDRVKLECRETGRARDKAHSEQATMKQHYSILLASMREDEAKMRSDIDSLRMANMDLRQRVTQLVGEQARAGKEVHSMKAERDAIKQEYRLIMSERDDVHKHVESLEKRISDLSLQLDKTDKARVTLTSELENTKMDYMQLQEHVKGSKKLAGSLVGSEWAEDSEDSYDTQGLSRSNSSRFQAQLAYGRQKRDVDSKTVEAAKREVDRLQRELTESRQEVRDAQTCRDWAFSERDKMLTENKSLHEHTDRLRCERDGAVSKLADAIRDCDELKRQKTDAAREAKDLREKYENLIDKQMRENQLNATWHNRSHDSAIDTDLQEWETETIDVDIDIYDYGFELTGTSDNCILVSSVSENSCAYGKLRPSDQVVRVNSVDLLTAGGGGGLHQYLRSLPTPIRMVVKRRKPVARSTHTAHLHVTPGRDAGIVVEQGAFISRIIPGSAAAKDNMIAVGDRITNINGRTVDGLSVGEVAMLLQQCEHVAVNVHKFSPLSAISVAPSSSSSGHNLTDYLPDSLSISPHSVPATDLSGPALRSSSSQTDCLAESPVPQEKPKRDEKRTLLDRAVHRIRQFKSAKRQQHDEHCRSFVDNNVKGKSAQDEVLEELDSVIEQYTTDRSATLARDSCGTWPRYRPYTDHVTDTPKVAFSRPVQPADSSGSGTLKRAVERNESFKRSASFKHSPQNSDSSTVKMSPYASMRHSPDTTTKTVTSVSALPSFLPTSSSKSKGLPNLEKIPERPDDMRSYAKTHRLSPPPDYSVTSNKQADDVWNTAPLSKNKCSRPVSALPACYMSADVPAVTVYSVPLHTYGQSPERPLSLEAHTRYTLPRDTDKVTHTLPRDTDKVTHTLPRDTDKVTHTLPRDTDKVTHTLPRDTDKVTHTVRPMSMVQKPTSLDIQSIFDSQLPVRQGQSPTTGHALSLAPPPRPSDKQRAIVRPSLTDSTAGSYYVGTIGSGPLLSHSVKHAPPTHHYGAENRIPPPFRSHPDSKDKRVADLYPPPIMLQDVSGRVATADDSPYHRFQSRTRDARAHDLLPPDDYTICRHKPHMSRSQERYIASNHSMQSSGLPSTSSFDQMSDAGSPLSPCFPGSPLGDLRHSSDSYGYSGSSVASDQPVRKRHRPKTGELRRIQGKKSTEQLGINIKSREGRSGGGVVVSSVSENSLAANAGIEVGDQLLEVNGINLRKASYDHAASVLRQCGSSIDMLVQFDEDNVMETQEADSDPGEAVKPSPLRSSLHQQHHHHSNETLTPELMLSMYGGNTGPKNQGLEETGVCQDARLVIVKKTHAHESLGVQVIGGNATGIFVHVVQTSSAANGVKGLRRGDQILEFNGVNFRNVTAEQAYLEMCKPAESVTLWAQLNMAKYSVALDQPCDALYVRALFDRQAEQDGELTFHKDDILFVDNTLCNGRPGSWRATVVDDDGKRHKSGTVPSKARIEDELVRKHSLPELVDEDAKGSHRTSLNARRSFFKRRRHQRNSSKDSRDFIHSDISINGDSVGIHEDGSCATYERVERLDGALCRPVIIVGAFADAVINKLISESPDKYLHIDFEMMKVSRSSLQINDGVFVDFRSRTDGFFDCITVQSVKEGMEKSRHCLLNVQPTAADTLRKAHIYPISLLIKHKSARQIKDTKDARFLRDKLNSKAAKELFDVFKDYETKYKRYFADVVSGDNLAQLATRIKDSISAEQKRTIWFASGNL